MRLTLEAAAAVVTAADTDTRQLRGVVVPYGQPGNTSAGRVTIDAGAVRVPDKLSRVKSFLEHGRQVPTGFGLEAADAADGLSMVFNIARTPDGDRALLEASEGIRDAFSVELDNVVIRAGHVTSADLVAVAQVAVPAFHGAMIAAADTPGPVPADPDSADPGELEAADALAPGEYAVPAGAVLTVPDDAADDGAPEPAADAAAPTPTGGTMNDQLAASRTLAMTPTRPTPARGSERRLWAARAAEALRGATDAAAVNAALADITPADSGTDGVFPRPAWIGELWQPNQARRPLVDAIGVQPLTGMKVEGWKWETMPEVAPYAGNKEEVPTSPAKIVPAEAAAQRIAGGWDLDRIYVDFSTGFLEAFQEAAVRDYRRKSGTYFLNGHAAIVGPPAIAAADGILADATDLGPSADLVAAIQEVVGFLIGNGAQVSFLAMAGDAFQDFFGMTSDEAPWWLAKQAVINLDGTTDLASVTVVVDPNLPAGTVAGGDREAVDLYETGPINVNAINLPNGGVDFGLFGYWAQLVHDGDGLAKTTVGAGGAAAAAVPSSSYGE